MSKIFYDYLLDFRELDKKIKKIAKSAEEREEIWKLVDEIVHHRILGCILDNLPKKNHSEFLNLFHSLPYDSNLLMNYLKEQIGNNFEELLKQEIGSISTELLKEIS